MSLHPTQAPSQAAPSQAAPSPHATDAQAYIQILQDLITMGADLARLVHHQATAHAQAPQPATQPPAPIPSPEPLISLTTAFDRIARAIRRSITLAHALAHPIQPAPNPAQPRAAARRRILREVEDTIHRAANDAAPPDAGRTTDLTAELYDRLDTPDLDDDLAARPIPDIITEICRDLGLAARPGPNPWKRRTPADIQHLCARAAAPQPAAAPAPSCTTPQRPLDPEPPPINLRPRVPTHPGIGPPDDPAEAIATILRHPGLRTRWPPPSNP